MTPTDTARLAPLDPPYEREIATTLARMMPPDTEPLALFRTVAHNRHVLERWRTTGAYLLNFGTIEPREREIVIHRTTARCGCEYEWGVHVAFFAERVGLSGRQVASITHGDAADPCWDDERDRLLIEAADALHDRADLGDELWARLAAVFTDAELLDVLLLCGWYHAISYAANGARLAPEAGAPRFADFGAAPATSA